MLLLTAVPSRTRSPRHRATRTRFLNIHAKEGRYRSRREERKGEHGTRNISQIPSWGTSQVAVTLGGRGRLGLRGRGGAEFLVPHRQANKTSNFLSGCLPESDSSGGTGRWLQIIATKKKVNFG